MSDEIRADVVVDVWTKKEWDHKKAELALEVRGLPFDIDSPVRLAADKVLIRYFSDE